MDGFSAKLGSRQSGAGRPGSKPTGPRGFRNAVAVTASVLWGTEGLDSGCDQPGFGRKQGRPPVVLRAQYDVASLYLFCTWPEDAGRSCRPSLTVRTDTRTIAPKSLTSPHGNASDKCDGSHLPVTHNDSCPCMDSSGICSTLAVTCCERSIIESDEVALSSFGMQSRSPPDSN